MEDGALRTLDGRPSVEHEVIRERCEALSVEGREIGGQRRAGSRAHGAIWACGGRPSVEHEAICDRREREVMSAEQSGFRTDRKVREAEKSESSA